MEKVDRESAAGGFQASRQRITTFLIIAIVLTGAFLVVLDWGKFAPVLAQADWQPVFLALLLTLISYLCVSYAFTLVNQILGIQVSRRDLIGIGFVTIVMNHVLTTGGVAGYSVRYLLMRKHGVSLKDVLAASILHFYLTSLDMLAMLPVGFLYLLLNTEMPAGVTALLGMMTGLMAIVAVVATGLIFFISWRQRLVQFLVSLGSMILHRNLSETLTRFDDTLTRGVSAMRQQPSKVLLVITLTWIDWFSSVGVVWLCFDAFGQPIRFGVILAGYVIGVMAGVLSMVPGGYGVQEGSMTAIFVLLGASFQQALLASILFRGVYFFLPYGISLVFYGRLLKTTRPDGYS
jgi:hypothetical protein